MEIKSTHAFLFFLLVLGIAMMLVGYRVNEHNKPDARLDRIEERIKAMKMATPDDVLEATR